MTFFALGDFFWPERLCDFFWPEKMRDFFWPERLRDLVLGPRGLFDFFLAREVA